MLQNININGMNINGLQSNNSERTVAAGCDLSIKRFDLGKPLSKPSVPHMTMDSYPTVIRQRRLPMLHQQMQSRVWQRVETLVATAVLEPPAAAWASLVIARSTSV